MQKKSSSLPRVPVGIAPCGSSPASSCGSNIAMMRRVYYPAGDAFVRPYHVGIAGATGLVGQRLVARVALHPWFRLAALGASERSAARAYGDVTRWMLREPIPEGAAAMV